MAVPFEALDVSNGCPVLLNVEAVYKKVVEQKRGGYCYELNLLFHAMLSAIGFDCHLISARIFENGKWGPEFDHMSLMIKLDDDWLADVGFGDLFLEPVKILPQLIQYDKFKTFKILLNDADEYELCESIAGNPEFRLKYKFTLKSRNVSDFYDQNYWKQTSDDSYFVKNRVCTIPTIDGRKTILNNEFKVTRNGVTECIEIKGGSELNEVLKREFDMDIQAMA